MEKTIFISSTFEDLKEHRKMVWDKLETYQVNIRGMERFGARSQTPIQTCLTEVEQSDIFIGVIGYRLGSIESSSAKSFVQLEYERAYELKKEILIYLLDEHQGKITPRFVDFGEHHDKLESFKGILKERHTIDTFTDATDLTNKLDRKFKELLTTSPVNGEAEPLQSQDLLRKFLLLPKKYSSSEVYLKIKFLGWPFPASKTLCNSFLLDYGNTVGIRIEIVSPDINDEGLRYLFVDQRKSDKLFELLTLGKDKEIEIFATPMFTEETIDSIEANFVSMRNPPSNFSVSFLTGIGGDPFAKDEEPVQKEGHIILQLKEFIGTKK